MRWGSSKTRFARPIRWILASFNNALVPFTVEDVPSALLSQGHRFYSPDPFEAKNLEELTTKLRNNFVEPVVEMRKEKILKETIAVAKGAPEISDELLDENSFLCEWPTAISGSFPESYLELPEPVLVTAMAKHERMFPVRDENEKLTNSFVFIRNSGEDETVARGCEWVLGARFNDARFFYEQDQKSTLDDFLEKTNDMLFQAQLGTVRQRADRLSKLAAQIAYDTDEGSAKKVEWARLAGLYAKADLGTGLVSELSSLQGIIGGEYAKASGLPDEVVHALSVQYKHPTQKIQSDADWVAAALIVADQMDKLTGYLGLGIEPSGSSDPFALRKSVTTLISLAENWEAGISFGYLVKHAVAGYAEQGFELDLAKAESALDTIFRGRYEALYSEYSHDVLQAVISINPYWLTDPKMVRSNLTITEELKAMPSFVQAASRPLNIVASAKKKNEPMSDDSVLIRQDMDTEEAKSLYDAVYEPHGVDSKAHLLSLVDPINSFFDNNMVMAEDPTQRFHRLSLANAAGRLLLTVADFTKLEG
jgi:glycyl-tRNA synthetase beta chain